MATFALLYTEAQNSTSYLPKGLKLAERMLTASSPSEGCSTGALVSCLDRVLASTKNAVAVERLLTFTGMLCAAHPGLLLSPTLAHAAGRLDAKDKGVRLRACQLVAAVTAAMPEDAELDDALFTSLVKHLLARSRDKQAAVRAAAASALARLQDGGAARIDPARAQLAWLVRHDGSKDVRSAALRALQLDVDSLPLLVEHTRDVAAEVRAAGERW